jgi:hypothetical protein
MDGSMKSVKSLDEYYDTENDNYDLPREVMIKMIEGLYNKNDGLKEEIETLKQMRVDDKIYNEEVLSKLMKENKEKTKEEAIEDKTGICEEIVGAIINGVVDDVKERMKEEEQQKRNDEAIKMSMKMNEKFMDEIEVEKDKVIELETNIIAMKKERDEREEVLKELTDAIDPDNHMDETKTEWDRCSYSGWYGSNDLEGQERLIKMCEIKEELYTDYVNDEIMNEDAWIDEQNSRGYYLIEESEETELRDGCDEKEELETLIDDAGGMEVIKSMAKIHNERLEKMEKKNDEAVKKSKGETIDCCEEIADLKEQLRIAKGLRV